MMCSAGRYLVRSLYKSSAQILHQFPFYTNLLNLVVLSGRELLCCVRISFIFCKDACCFQEIGGEKVPCPRRMHGTRLTDKKKQNRFRPT